MEGKLPDLGILRLEVQKCIVLFSAPSNFPNCQFLWKTKMPKFGTKNAIFAYFGGRIKKKLLSYLKSAPSNLFNCKFLRRTAIRK